MLDTLAELVSYSFVQRALFVGILVSLCSSVLGVTLVLKRYSMIGDGLSHVGFGSLCVALVMNVAPLKVSVPVVILAAFFLLRLSENAKVKGDAAIAMISGTSIAVGVTATSLSGGLNNDVSGYMFGSIFAMSNSDVALSVGLSVAVLLLYTLFYNRIFAVTFDETFTRATGTGAGVFNTMIALLTAVTVVIGMRIMGTMLISSLIIFPPLTAMRFCKSFRGVVVASAIISVVCFTVGTAVSLAISTPPGASIVIVNAVAFALSSAVSRIAITAKSKRRTVGE